MIVNLSSLSRIFVNKRPAERDELLCVQRTTLGTLLGYVAPQGDLLHRESPLSVQLFVKKELIKMSLCLEADVLFL